MTAADTPDTDFDRADIAAAQFAIDHYPINSPYWDSRAAQDVMACERELKLVPTTSEHFRREWHSAQMQEVRDEAGAA